MTAAPGAAASRSAAEGALLSVEALHAYYGLSHVLFGVTLHAASGEVVAVLGRNGAGKSTTLRSIMGLLPPRSGRVVFRGQDIAGWAPHRICRRGVGFVPEDRRIFPDLTVHENLEVGRRPLSISLLAAGRDARRRPGALGVGTPPPGTGADRLEACAGPSGEVRPPGGGGLGGGVVGTPPPIGWSHESIYDFFPILGQRRQQKGGTLSGGEQQMLTIARTLMGNPEILLLDEPSEGLAPVVVRTLLDRLEALKASGQTILLSEQNLRFATRLADRVYILEQGQVRYQGTIAELQADETVRQAYLLV